MAIKPKPFQCSLCKKRFTTRNGTEMHLGNFHKKKQGEVIKYEKRKHDDDESFADRAIEAEINKACGESYEAWLLGE